MLLKRLHFAPVHTKEVRTHRHVYKKRIWRELISKGFYTHVTWRYFFSKVEPTLFIALKLPFIEKLHDLTSVNNFNRHIEESWFSIWWYYSFTSLLENVKIPISEDDRNKIIMRILSIQRGVLTDLFSLHVRWEWKYFPLWSRVNAFYLYYYSLAHDVNLYFLE